MDGCMYACLVHHSLEDCRKQQFGARHARQQNPSAFSSSPHVKALGTGQRPSHVSVNTRTVGLLQGTSKGREGFGLHGVLIVAIERTRMRVCCRWRQGRRSGVFGKGELLDLLDQTGGRQRRFGGKGNDADCW